MDWLGIAGETQLENERKTCFLTPNNTRLKRIILNYENEILSRIWMEGGEFALPFLFIAQFTDEYKRTFNYYDGLEEEQFMFYPGKTGQLITAIESWIPTEEQKKDLSEIRFSIIFFHLSKDKKPYHFKTGWHMITLPKS